MLGAIKGNVLFSAYLESQLRGGADSETPSAFLPAAGNDNAAASCWGRKEAEKGLVGRERGG